MRGGAPRRAAGRWLVGCVAIVAALWAQEGVAQPAVVGSKTGRVRPVDTKAAALLKAGAARSETFRGILEGLEHSDLVVYVETGVLDLPGQVHLAAATPGTRYVRVSIRVPGLEDDLLPWLAHELWHATEIARAPQVTTQESLLAHYERIGGAFRAGSAVIMETAAAQGMQAQVERELHAPPRSRPKRP
jgi:hypothetical protein